MVKHYLTTHKSNQTTPSPRSEGEESEEEIEMEPSLSRKEPLNLNVLISQFVFLYIEDATKQLEDRKTIPRAQLRGERGINSHSNFHEWSQLA